MKLRIGFTLVELLIVIVIIGVLAGAMLLASGAATASAEASNIVSNLRSLQSASLMFFADHMDPLMAPTVVLANFWNSYNPLDDSPGGEAVQHLVRYTNNPEAAVWDNYAFHITGAAPLADSIWWVSAAVNRLDVASRLEGRADSVGLYDDAHDPVPAGGPDFSGGVGRVYMLIRNPAD